MPETIRVGRKELTSSEIVHQLENGNRVIVEVNVLGRTMNMAIRRQGGPFYCDTPMKLLTSDTRDEMQACLERYRLAKPASEESTSDVATAIDE